MCDCRSGPRKRYVTAMTSSDGTLYAACNDGTVWYQQYLAHEWKQLERIPQPDGWKTASTVTLESGRQVKTTQGTPP